MTDKKSPSQDSITKELKWGREFRSQKEHERRKSLQPQIPRINEAETWQRYQLTKELEELKRLDRMLMATPIPKSLKLPRTKTKKRDKLERCRFNKKQYWDYMSTPRDIVKKSTTDLKLQIKKKLQKQRCSARIEALALPTFAHVTHTWKTFGHILSSEIKSRFGEILSSDHNLNMKYAKCYFKSMDYLRRKERAERRRKHRMKLMKLKRHCRKQFKRKIAKIASSICECLAKEPLYAINYKQTLISDSIFQAAVKAGYLKKIPSRTSASVYKRTLVDLVDQIAVCIDIVGLHMDVKFMGRGDLPESILTSTYAPEEEEGEEFPEKPREPFHLPPFDLPPFPPLPPYPEMLSPQKLVSLFEKGEGYEGESTDSLIKSYKNLGPKDENLEMLIQMLSRTPNEDLSKPFQPEMMPGLTYQDVLGKIKELNNRERAKKEELRKNVVQETLLVWAYENAADDVDDNIKHRILEVAEALSRCFSKSEMKK